MSLDSKRTDGTGLTEIPPKVRETADRISRDYERRMQQSVESYEKRISDILDKARAEIRGVVGPKNWPALRRLMRHERLTWRERMQPPDGPFRDVPAEIRARKEGALKFLDGVGVSPNQIRQIAEGPLRQIRDMSLTPATRPGHAYPLPGHEDKLSDLLGGPLQGNPHRWFTFRPPFESGQLGTYIARSPHAYRVGVYPEVDLDIDTGRIRNRMWLSIFDASDLDLAHGLVDSQVEFAFTAPTAGKVEVAIVANCSSCLHELKVEDEWGVSDSTTDQNNFLMTHVLHPNVAGPVVVSMSHFRWETDNSTSQTHEFLTRGSDYFVNLTNDGTVSANDTMVIRAGTRTEDATMTNDMAIDSKSTFEWTIKAVHVRIAP